MTQATATTTTTTLKNRPAWVDLSTTDAAAARDFYSKLFGWELEVSEDPEYGGYATAKLGDSSVGGIGPKQPGDSSPSSWSIYIGTDDIDAMLRRAGELGGTVLMPKSEIPGTGWMAIFTDPDGRQVGLYTDMQR